MHQISNVFSHQIPPEEIDQYSGVRSGTIKADFYDDCNAIPDPSDLDTSQKNLLLLDDCFLGKQNKAEAYYTRGRHNNTTTIGYTLLKTTSAYPAIQFGRIQTLLSFSHKTRRISPISMLTTVLVTYPPWNSNSFVIDME